MADDVVARAKAALEGVTEGPWMWTFPDRGDDALVSATALTEYKSYDGEACSYPSEILGGVWHNDDTAGISVSDADAAFIAESVGLVSDLVAEVEQLRRDMAWHGIAPSTLKET